MKNIIVVLLLFCFTCCNCQTLQQEYSVKQEYKNSKPLFDYKSKTVSVFGKSYSFEESYFELLFAVLPNGDYICMPRQGAFEFMERVCAKESRFKVHIGNNPMEKDRQGGISYAIWILRKNK